MTPQIFFWGTATASHQSEGNTTNDWTAFEHANAHRLADEAEKKIKPLVPDWEAIKAQATNPDNYISGIASDHYARFKEDIAIIKSLGITAYRFAIEWARIFPQEDTINEQELQHYQDVINELRANNIEPFITIWHRSLPQWIAAQGGWENKKTIKDFLQYTDTLLSRFGTQVQYWMPMNEPNLYTGASYAGGGFPPGKNNLFKAYRVLKNLATAQNQAYVLIHKHRPDAEVGLPMAAVYATAYKDRWYNKVLARVLHFVANELFINWTKRGIDFIGVQYYRRGILRLKFGGKFLLQIREESNTAAERSRKDYSNTSNFYGTVTIFL
jgi:beta-glucosidase